MDNYDKVILNSCVCRACNGMVKTTKWSLSLSSVFLSSPETSAITEEYLSGCAWLWFELNFLLPLSSVTVNPNITVWHVQRRDMVKSLKDTSCLLQTRYDDDGGGGSSGDDVITWVSLNQKLAWQLLIIIMKSRQKRKKCVRSSV